MAGRQVFRSQFRYVEVGVNLTLATITQGRFCHHVSNCYPSSMTLNDAFNSHDYGSDIYNYDHVHPTVVYQSCQSFF